MCRTAFHPDETRLKARAGDNTCRVGSRPNTYNGQLRHRRADDALSSGQPLDDATAPDQQEISDTDELPHQNAFLGGIPQPFLVIRGISPAAWRSRGGRGGSEKARG